MDRAITLAVAGCGSRGYDTYARLIGQMPDKARIVAAADPDPGKLAAMRTLAGIGGEACFSSAEAMLEAPRLADAMLICTQDRQHFPHAKAALEKGYDLLLEKPISWSAGECTALADMAGRLGRRVVVCHVLRYTAFYQKIKQLLDAGAVGEVVNLQAIEQVCYWHQAHSYVRGNWRSTAETSCMILAKCCHDLDMLLWLTGKRCRRVSSFGSLYLFRPEKAPQGSGERCVSCGIAGECPYNAVRFYMDRLKVNGDAWPQNVVVRDPDAEKLMEALREGPYGRCVYRSDNDAVDHQVVNLEFTDGATASLTMTGFTAHPGRLIRVGGTVGEIYGDMEAKTIRVMRYGKEDEVIDVTTLAGDFSGHGGGDAALLRDFIGILRGEPASATTTSIERSVESHLIALAAEESRLKGGMPVTMDE